MLRGFSAFDLFLEQHPEFTERVTFIAQLMPSRTDVPQYAEYLERIEALVAVVNHRHGTPDWMPIQLKLRDDLEEAMAAYKHYDVLLVNAMFDGMNLVAKEGPLVNEREGVSILSENTGAHEELGEYALSVNPFDIQELADSIHAALTMDTAERRRRRATGLVEIVTSRDPGDWIDEQLADIRAKAPRARGRRSGRETRYPCPLRMTLPAPTYDLMLLLDPQAEESARAKIVADAVAAIEAQGELVRQDDWGERPLAYPIDRKASAEYHLLQFHVGQTALLEGLDRTLRITDGVLRFRIIKLKPGAPDAPEMTAPRGAPTPRRGRPTPAPAAPARGRRAGARRGGAAAEAGARRGRRDRRRGARRRRGRARRRGRGASPRRHRAADDVLPADDGSVHAPLLPGRAARRNNIARRWTGRRT